MPRRNNSPGDSSDTEPFKCTRCGRVEDEPGKPKDPRPWVCSHCQHDFETEFALKAHLRKTKCKYPHKGEQAPRKERLSHLRWRCPRCKLVLRSKFSADRHIKNRCWKICDECVEDGNFDSCSLQYADYTDSACIRCLNKGISCTAHTGPIAGNSVPVKPDKPADDTPTGQEKGKRRRRDSSSPLEEERPKRSRVEAVPEVSSDLGEIDDTDYNPSSPQRSPSIASNPVYLLPARRYQNRWVPQGTIFDLSDIPQTAVPLPQPVPAVPSLSTTEALRRSHAERDETTESDVWAGVVPSSPPVPSLDDSEITIHVRNLHGFTDWSFKLRRSDAFGPRLNQYCEYHGQRLHQDWVFVWYSADPLPGRLSNLRGTVIRWHYTPASFGPPRFPRMGDFEYVYVYRSDDEEIQNVLREYPEEQALINAYREARLAAEYRLGNQAFYHRRGDGAQVEQDPAASAPFEPQALASFADETPEANGIGPAATDVGTGSQHYEAGFVDDYDDDDLYADP